ncbi:hypothetical protein AAEX28_04475 [Lentisphaerota bacterium WC36G]|nr:hypothetical protein LJT99_07340 [Lentisphaerae bacterium WC36]
MLAKLNLKKLLSSWVLLSTLAIINNGCQTTDPISGDLTPVVEKQNAEEKLQNYSKNVNEIVNSAVTSFLTKAPSFLPQYSVIENSFATDSSIRAMLGNHFQNLIEGTQLYNFSPKSQLYFNHSIIKNNFNQPCWQIKLVNRKSKQILWQYEKNIVAIY